jgi:hypothetical protein
VSVTLLESSDDEESQHGGLNPGKRPNLNRDFEMGHANIMRDYLVDAPVYTDELFRRRFRMSKGLCLKVVEEVTKETPFLQQRKDALGNLDLILCKRSRWQYVCWRMALQRMLPTNTAGFRSLWPTIVLNNIYIFNNIYNNNYYYIYYYYYFGIIRCFESVYLCAPTPSEINQIQKYNASQGWPGQAFSIDCMHWVWKNCPKAYAGMYL